MAEEYFNWSAVFDCELVEGERENELVGVPTEIATLFGGEGTICGAIKQHLAPGPLRITVRVEALEGES
jgi:hypothetical protein